ncbi:MAG TPA: hypothetical protein VLL05_13820, partial [Terriglobales bacterium]|nr:hypothetical protein [Terriglobales bacterium]
WGWDSSEHSLGRDYEFGKYMYVLAASGYELEVEMRRANQTPVVLKLQVVGSNGEVMRNVQSLYPQQLIACTSVVNN